MIGKILSRLGYIHRSELTEDFLFMEVGKLVGDPEENIVDPKIETEFFNGLARVNYVNEYLSSMMSKDMQRDFGTPDEGRQMIRGAFARTSYFKSRLRKESEDKAELKIGEKKIAKLRYS